MTMNDANWGQTITIGPALKESAGAKRQPPTIRSVKEYDSLLNRSLGSHSASALRNWSRAGTAGDRVLKLLDCIDKILTDEQRDRVMEMYERDTR